MLGLVFRGRVCPGHLFEAMPGLEALTHRARGVTFGVVPLLLALALAAVSATPVAAAAPTLSRRLSVADQRYPVDEHHVRGYVQRR